MFVAKLNKNKPLIVKDKLEYYSFYSYMQEVFYIGAKIIMHPLKRERCFYIGINVDLGNDNIIKVFNEKMLVFETNTNDQDEVLKNVVHIESYKDDQFIYPYKEYMLNHIRDIIDLDSKDGKAALLLNFNISNESFINDFLKTIESYDFRRLIRCTSDNYYIDLTKVVGTLHNDYNNKSWIDAFYSLKRPINILKAIVFPEYYNDLQNIKIKKELISFVKIDDEYYISEGNHRTILAKINGLKYIYAPLCEYRTDTEYQEYYNKISEKGIQIEFPDTFHLNDYKDRFNIKYNWEIFKIYYNNNFYILSNIEEIKRFYIHLEKDHKISLFKKIKNFIFKYK